MNTDKIVEYRIITNDFSDMLAVDVNAAIQQGWRPTGGLCCSTYEMPYRDSYANVIGTETIFQYHQAMVKCEVRSKVG